MDRKAVGRRILNGILGAGWLLTPGDLQTWDRKEREFLKKLKEPLTMTELTNLRQSNLCSSLMGCIKGVSDFYDLDWTVPELFGYTTHAFLLNVHEDVCPSSPYLWNHDPFYLALRNLGIRKSGSICLTKTSTPTDIAEAEKKLRAHLDAGQLCILDFLEHQLIAGYDAQGFLFLKPWDCTDVELASLSFGTFHEALDREGWVQFTLLKPETLRADPLSLLHNALWTTLKMESNPAEFEMPHHRVGDRGWEAWIAGIDRGLGSTHGHWWTASVWEEGRRMTAEFFAEWAPKLTPTGSALGTELARVSTRCAEAIAAAKDRQTPAATQKAALAEGRRWDRERNTLIRKLLNEIAE